jgi:hypothetical protein
VNRFVEILRERGIGFIIAKAHLPLREAAVKLGMSDWLPNSEWSDHLEATVAKYEEISAADEGT